MRDLDRFVDLGGETEIIGGDDEPGGPFSRMWEKETQAASRRSFRKRKNSTPSRSRRFIMSGCRTISPTIEAILPERK